MTTARRQLGMRGEDLARARLVESGLTIVASNWRGRRGELDIVAMERGPDYSTGEADAAWLVLVEVRTRRGARSGSAMDSIGPRKQAKLRAVAQEYVQASNWRGPWRIDVVGVELYPNRPPQVVHLRAAVKDGEG